jgi:regulatory factor X
VPQNGQASANGHSDFKHPPNEKRLSLADPGFQTHNNDDSAIDLEDDTMLMAVGKYGDMMVSDPADAEGDVVVI